MANHYLHLIFPFPLLFLTAQRLVQMTASFIFCNSSIIWTGLFGNIPDSVGRTAQTQLDMLSLTTKIRLLLYNFCLLPM